MPLNVTDTALQIYRDRVGSTAFVLRWAGAGLMIAGCVCVLANLQRNQPHGTPLEWTGLALTGIGAVVMIVALTARTAFSRRSSGLKP
jgi:hypothetical protein